jgi:diguanylate cyclase (GGDEF)-like protein
LKSPDDSTQYRRALLQLLDAAPPREEQILARLQRRGQPGQPLYSALLYILTHLSFTEPDARRHWHRIQKHRQGVTKALGRDVGLRVAMLDYFVNVSRTLKNPKVIEISIYESTARSAVTDGLTGLHNRAYLDQAVRREIQRSQRYRLNLSLIMLDLDNFKRINDTLGHLAGDHCLVRTSELIRDSLREIDTAARYGGEEFALLLPDTPRVGAYVVAERIRARLVEERARSGSEGRATVSGGVATFPDDGATGEQLLRKADQALYAAKAQGKNRIALASGERREHFRLPTSELAVIDIEQSGRMAAVIHNVSEGGMLLHLHGSLPLGSNARLLTPPESSKPHRFRGEVVRVVECGNGAAPSYAVGFRLNRQRTALRTYMTTLSGRAPADV